MTSKIKLLFVDDEEGFRFFFREGLMNEALEIETASDGIEALKKLKTFPADIVVTDVKMPNMDGLLLLEEIRMRYPDIFVVMVTGHGAIEDAVKAMKAGAYDYILKPFDFDTIRRMIDKITGHKRILQKSIFPGKERRKKHRFEDIKRKSEPLIHEFFLPTRQTCEAGGNGEGMGQKIGCEGQTTNHEL